MSKLNFILLFVFVSLFLENVKALQCYSCSSIGCEDDFNAMINNTNRMVKVETCSNNFTINPIFPHSYRSIMKENNLPVNGLRHECIKIKLDGTNQVSRSCVPAIKGYDSCEILKTLAGRNGLDCITCSTDLCNSSININKNNYNYALIIIISVIMYLNITFF